MSAQERIRCHTLGCSVIVSLVGEMGILDAVLDAVQFVNVFDIGELVAGCEPRPVFAVGNHHLRPRRGERGDLGVVGFVCRALMNRHGAFADASSEEMGRDLADGNTDCNPIVNCCQEE